jgi:hypothetical protein
MNGCLSGLSHDFAFIALEQARHVLTAHVACMGKTGNAAEKLPVRVHTKNLQMSMKRAKGRDGPQKCLMPS